jgi:flagellar protein FlbD
MIKLHRLDDTVVLINLDLIEIVEETPDTVITLTNENKYLVKEKITEIMEKIIEFKCHIHFKQMVVDDTNKGINGDS